MSESTVNFGFTALGQGLLKDFELCLSESKERLDKYKSDPEREEDNRSIVNLTANIETLKRFKVFFSIKGSFTVTKSDIVQLRTILDIKL